MNNKRGYQWCGGADHSGNPNRRDFLFTGALGGMGLGLTLGDMLTSEAKAAGEDWVDVAKASGSGRGLT